MEEASSVSKAIEKGWNTAGKPKEFTVKVYEEAEKNFIGMTTKSAKIGIFFSEPRKTEGRQRRGRTDQARQSKPRAQPAREPRRETRQPEEKREDLGPIWSDDMVASAKEWLSEILKHLGRGSVPYTIEPQRFHLRIEFGKSVLDDKDKQKHLFAIFSGLLLTMLKRHYKRPLRGYKIVLTEEGSER